MKLAAKISILTLILGTSMMATTFFNSSTYAKSEDDLLSISYAKREAEEKQSDIIRISTTENKTSSLPSNNQVQGIVIVTKKVINEGGGDKKPSDFTITIHGNDPSPSSFLGSSSGTSVKLYMGMYSITETGPSGYNSSMSDDCSGGVMSVETKKCTITNIYSKPAVSNVTNGN